MSFLKFSIKTKQKKTIFSSIERYIPEKFKPL